MKRKHVRIGLVLILLGAVAAVPASTQILSADSNARGGRAGDNLPLLLVVNRLELSRAQMETLRGTVRGLLDEQALLESKRADFETEMIAFSGTAEQLDTRIAAFKQEMATARSSLQSKVAASIDTLKETLTMKQGEILLEAFPGLFGRLDAAAARAPLGTRSSVTMPARGSAFGVEGAAIVQQGRATVTKGAGRITITTPGGDAASSASGATQSGSLPAGAMGRIGMRSGMVGVGASDSTPPLATRVGAMVEKIRDRLARRVDAADSAAAPMGPMCAMGMMAAPGADSEAQIVGSIPDSESASDFGMLTISLGPASASLSVGTDGGSARTGLVDWLERLLRVLELKLAAVP